MWLLTMMQTQQVLSDYIGFEPSPLDWTKLENTFKKRPSVTGGWDLHYKANLVSPF